MKNPEEADKALQELYSENDDHTIQTNDTPWQDLMSTYELYISSNNMLDIMQECIDNNDDIFEEKEITYSYKTWLLNSFHDEDNTNESTWTWKWELPESSNDYPEDTTTQDGLYGIVTRQDIEGEKNSNGYHKFMMHWQEVMALAFFYGYGNVDEWGKSDDSEYESEGAFEINSVEGYYLSDEEFKSVVNFFKYDFNYYYDAVDGSSSYKYDDLASGLEVGYRINHIADPDHETTMTTVEKNEYIQEHGSDFYTKYVPESAPNTISNIYETYKYVYISSEDTSAGLWRDDFEGAIKQRADILEEDDFEPPEGSYCAGRWQIINPYYFMNTMANMFPWFYETELSGAARSTYCWEDEMIERYVYYLELIYDATPSATYASERIDFFNELKEMYKNKEIKAYYTGVAYDGMEEYVAELEEKFPGWTVTVEYDTGYTYQTEFSNAPFRSFGITIGKNTAELAENSSGNTTVVPSTKASDYIYIYKHGSFTVDGWFGLNEGSDDSLVGSTNYSKSEIGRMLDELEDMGGGAVPFSSALDEVYEWYCNNNYPDIAAFCAIIVTEGGFKSSFAKKYYNVFNMAPYGDEPYFTNSGRNWLDCKAKWGTFPAAFVGQMNKILNNYWNKGQDTFYKMTFNNYGYPGSEYALSTDEAELEICRQEATAADPGITHAFCPWWDDTGYKTTNWNSDYAWCNKNAAQRAKFQVIGGS